MNKKFGEYRWLLLAAICPVVFAAGCGGPYGVPPGNVPPQTNSNTAVNTSSNSSSNTNTASPSVTVDTKEPANYQATVNLRFEAVGSAQQTQAPPIISKIARNGQSRRMEFSLPLGGTLVFLDVNGTNYLILPEKKQYAELNRESIGFGFRRLMMPDQMIDQIKAMPGVRQVGEEKYNGRDAVKYEYGAVADTQSQAGKVATQSYFLVDKETGLPLRLEVNSQSQSGANVQGVNGLRMITEISSLTTEAPDTLFAKPAGYQKIESEQVRSQVELVFKSLAAVAGQLIKQAKPAANSSGGSPTP